MTGTDKETGNGGPAGRGAGEPDRQAPPAGAAEPKGDGGTGARPWVKPVLLGAGLVLLAAGAGFGIGYATRGGSGGPDLSGQEAYEQAREATQKEVSREMARLGFEEGKRTGYRHGLVAGGMAAESDASVVVRERWADQAQAAAAAAQAELAGMTGAPPTPTPDIPGE